METPTLQLSFLCPYTKQHRPSQQQLKHHSKPLSHPPLSTSTNKENGPWQAEPWINYLLEATPISSANQPMAEQADQQWPV